MIGIFDILFEVLPYLIWGAGPFCVFKGMGTGKDSGKLLFKKIYSDSGVSITENSTNLDIKASGGVSSDQSIGSNEIAFGCGSGITSSAFSFLVCTDLGYRSIHEVAMIGSGIQSTNKYGKLTANYENLIIGGNWNKITNNKSFLQPQNNQLIGGFYNYVYYDGFGTVGSVDRNSIIGGALNCTCGDVNNTILSGSSNQNSNSQFSSIISSVAASINGVSTSTIISSNADIQKVGSSCQLSSAITAGGFINDSSFSTILGTGVKFDKNSYSTVLNGLLNWMCDCSYTSTVVNGCYNHIVPGNDKSSYSSTIFNGFKNCFRNQNSPLDGVGGMRYSSIMNGKYNYFLLPSGSRQDEVLNSNILNGSKNILTLSENFGFTPSSAVILNGYKNCFDYAVSVGINPGIIFNGVNNCILSVSNNTILSGQNAKLYTSRNSLISSSNQAYSTYNGGLYSTIISAGVDSTNYICNPVNNAYSSYNTIINLTSYRSSPSSAIPCNIITTDQSNGSKDIGESIGVVQQSNLILSLYGGNCIVGSASNSVIIAQTSSRIFNCTISANKFVIRPRNNRSSMIIGNYHSISNGLQSVIIGGYNNKMETTKDSIIIGGESNSINGWKGAEAKGDASILYWKQSGIVGGCNNILQTTSSFTFKEAHTVVLVGTENLVASNYKTSTTVIPNMCITDTLSWCGLGTKKDGAGTNSFSSISSIEVCNGIIVNWTI
jgi:hypothetical protein